MLKKIFLISKNNVRRFCSQEIVGNNINYHELKKITKDLKCVTNFTELRVVLNRVEFINQSYILNMYDDNLCVNKQPGNFDERLFDGYLFNIYEQMDKICCSEFRNFGSNDIVRLLEMLQTLKVYLEHKSMTIFNQNFNDKRFYTKFDQQFMFLNSSFLSFVKEQILSGSKYSREEKLSQVIPPNLNKKQLSGTTKEELQSMKKDIKDFFKNIALGFFQGKFTRRINDYEKTIVMTLEEKLYFVDILFEASLTKKNYKIATKIVDDFDDPSNFFKKFGNKLESKNDTDINHNNFDFNIVSTQYDYLILYLIKSYWEDIEKIFANHYPPILWHKEPIENTFIEKFSKKMYATHYKNRFSEIDDIISGKQQSWLLEFIEYDKKVNNLSFLKILMRHQAVLSQKNKRFKKLVEMEIGLLEKLLVIV